MTSFVPRDPYSREELNQLYPKGLQLQLVQVFLRHGERSPVSARFQNAGLDAYWPYCNVARRLSYMAASKEDLSTWDVFRWRRKMEQFGANDEALIAVGPEGESEGICHPGELTDRGRQTTYALGQRLRHLYVNQLGFMPAIQSSADNMYLRTTPIPRAMESLQETFWGMYPKSARTESFKIPTIVARSPAEETLFPNEGNCRRFRQLARLFAERAAERWNDSEEMEYLNSLWSKWMPSHSPRVAVDSRPRLSGIMDTVNATLAHGPKTRLPMEFYDPKAREYIDKIAMDEWFAGYKESREYRKVGIGGLVGDITDRMVSTAAEGGWRPHMTPTGEDDSVVKFAISGCHDTTIAALLTSLGAFDNGHWPPYTSSIAVELFKDVDGPSKRRQIQKGDILEELQDPATAQQPSTREKQFSFLSFLKRRKPSPIPPNLSETARAPISALPTQKLKDHYVRIRYNDQPVIIPGCAAKARNHLPGDESFCTLEAFKEITDKFTPANWREACAANSGKGMFEEGRETAGF